MKIAQEVWFHDKSGSHKGYVEKVNKNTINVLTNDENKVEGYKLWRIEEFFLSKNKEEAIEKWNDYRNRLFEYKKILRQKRKQHEFFEGLSVLIEPFNKEPYKGMVLNIKKNHIDIVTTEKKFMRVDKAISTPINEIINF